MKKFIGKLGLKKEPRDPSPKAGGASAASAESTQGYDIREKDLTKIHKAAWNGDLAKVKQLAKKDPNSQDKEHRYWLFFVHNIYTQIECSYESMEDYDLK